MKNTLALLLLTAFLLLALPVLALEKDKSDASDESEASEEVDIYKPKFGPGKPITGRTTFGPITLLWSVSGELYEEALVIVKAKGQQVAQEKLTTDKPKLIKNAVPVGREKLDIELVFYPPSLHTVGELIANKLVLTNEGLFTHETRFKTLASWRDDGRPQSWFIPDSED